MTETNPTVPPRNLTPSHQVTAPAAAGTAAGVVGTMLAVRVLHLVDPLEVGAVAALIAQGFGALVSYIQSGGRRGENLAPRE